MSLKPHWSETCGRDEVLKPIDSRSETLSLRWSCPLVFCTMRAFARNASSRDELKDEENPAPTTPVDYSGTTPGSNLKGRPTARFSSIELIQRDFDNESPTTKSLPLRGDRSPLGFVGSMAWRRTVTLCARRRSRKRFRRRWIAWPTSRC